MLHLQLRPRKAVCALAILLLFVPSCFATTVILLVTPSGMLIGADGKAKAVCTDVAARCIDDSVPNIKVVPVQKRFAVAAIGLQRADIMASDGTPLLVYDFKTWMEQIEERVFFDVTLSELTRIIKGEYTQLLVGLE